MMTATPVHQRRRSAGAGIRRGYPALGFLLPSLVILGIVVLVPLLYVVYLSFTDYSFIAPTQSRFVGVRNYIDALWQRDFRNSLWVTTVFTAVTVGLETILGLIVALALRTRQRYSRAFFSVYLMPTIITPISTGLVWAYILHPTLGVFNYVLGLLGAPTRAWLGEGGTALLSVCLVDVWEWTPLVALMLYAGLVSLPQEPMEAAHVDGATRWQVFRYVTMPLIKPVALGAVLIRTLDALKTFDIVYVLTSGGPSNRTELLSFHIYRHGFLYARFSYATAVSVLLLVGILVFTSILARMTMNEEKA